MQVKKEKKMLTIIELKKRVVAFWSKEMQKDLEQIKVIKIDATPDGWLARVQITEQNDYRSEERRVGKECSEPCKYMR